MSRNIRGLCERIRKAEEAMRKALEVAYPVGWVATFYIMHGQSTPSKGTVISHSGGRFAYVRVRLHSRTQLARDVPAENIFSVGKPL